MKLCIEIKPIEMLTKSLKAESFPTINQEVERMYKVHKELENIINENDSSSRPRRCTFAIILKQNIAS